MVYGGNAQNGITIDNKEIKQIKRKHIKLSMGQNQNFEMMFILLKKTRCMFLLGNLIECTVFHCVYQVLKPNL